MAQSHNRIARTHIYGAPWCGEGAEGGDLFNISFYACLLYGCVCNVCVIACVCVSVLLLNVSLRVFIFFTFFLFYLCSQCQLPCNHYNWFHFIYFYFNDFFLVFNNIYYFIKMFILKRKCKKERTYNSIILLFRGFWSFNRHLCVYACVVFFMFFHK